MVCDTKLGPTFPEIFTNINFYQIYKQKLHDIDKNQLYFQNLHEKLMRNAKFHSCTCINSRETATENVWKFAFSTRGTENWATPGVFQVQYLRN